MAKIHAKTKWSAIPSASKAIVACPSADAATAYEMSLKIRAGSVYINGGTGKMSYAPIGGYKRSGIGREYGPEWLKEFTQEKSIFYPVGH